MRSWFPDVAAEGREGRRIQRERVGRRIEPDEGAAMAAERNPIPDMVKDCLPSREPSRWMERGDWGIGGLVGGCRAEPRVVSGPSPPMLPGVRFHVSLGNDYLMEKLQALKMRKENKSINGGRLVPITVVTQLVVLFLVPN